MVVKIRSIIFIGVVILLCFCMLYSNETSLFSALNISQVTAYSNTKLEEYESTLSGNGYKFSIPTENYDELKNKIDGISFETSFTPEEIFNKLNVKIQSSQRLLQNNDYIEIFYCYVENLNSKSVIIDNKKVNLQIAFNEDFSVVGIPLILGSY